MICSTTQCVSSALEAIELTVPALQALDVEYEACVCWAIARGLAVTQDVTLRLFVRCDDNNRQI